MVKSTSSSQSSVSASSISSMNKGTKNTELPNKLKSKVEVPSRKKNGTIKVHVTQVKNDKGMISASVMNSYCCRVTTIVYHVPQFTTRCSYI